MLHGFALIPLVRTHHPELDAVSAPLPQTIELSPTEMTGEGSAFPVPDAKENARSSFSNAMRDKGRALPPAAAVNAREMATSNDASEIPWTPRLERPPGSDGPGVTRFGLGVEAPGGSINLNLSFAGVEQVVNPGEIAEIARNEEARRLASHRERWKAASFERWRPAMEGYVPRVHLGNQVALGASHAAFATFLKNMARRLRPELVDGFVDWIQSLPANHVLRRPHLWTRLEIVLDGASGSIAAMGVVLASGVSAFDVGALDAVQRAGPFGAAPAEILSPDGRVYVQWDLHNDRSSEFIDKDARPSILREAPKSPNLSDSQ